MGDGEASLYDMADSVSDVESFLGFVESLVRDREQEVADGQPDAFGRGPRGWENHTIESFLEAALAWARAGRMMESAPTPWSAATRFLHAGKFYE